MSRSDSVTEIYLSNRGDMVMPLGLELQLQDREGNRRTQAVALPVDMCGFAGGHVESGATLHLPAARFRKGAQSNPSMPTVRCRM